MAHNGDLELLTEETFMAELVPTVEAMAAEPAEQPRGLMGNRAVFFIDDMQDMMRKLDMSSAEVCFDQPPSLGSTVLLNMPMIVGQCVAHITKEKGPQKRRSGKHVSKWDRWS